jgi:hypothetical protein
VYNDVYVNYGVTAVIVMCVNRMFATAKLIHVIYSSVTASLCQKYIDRAECFVDASDGGLYLHNDYHIPSLINLPTHAHIHTCSHTSTQTFTCTHKLQHTHLHTHSYAHTHVCSHKHIHSLKSLFRFSRSVAREFHNDFASPHCFFHFEVLYSVESLYNIYLQRLALSLCTYIDLSNESTAHSIHLTSQLPHIH